MAASLDLHGMHRNRILKFLAIVAGRYESYNSNKVREWHIKHQLKKISELSSSKENSKEILAAIKDIEAKIKYSNDRRPLDHELMKKVLEEIRKVNHLLSARGPVQLQQPGLDHGHIDDARESLKNLLKDTNKKKVRRIEEKYSELKASSHADHSQLDGIRRTLDRLKSKLEEEN